MKFKHFVAFAALLLCAGTTAFAQTTASLTGEVNADGTPLPGVTVTISSPAMQGVRTTTTGENGGYNFTALPPGRYSVRFELAGMANVTREAQVSLSQSARADANMSVAGVAEAITVTASAPTALETSQVSTNVSKQLVDALPIARGQLAAAALAPGVNANTFAANQVTISGGPGYDNLIMVNGAVVTENIRSQGSPLYIEDAIQETTILTGAVSAEWGRFTGGVVNTITKSGGNQFGGSFRDSVTNNHWTAPTPDAADIANRPKSNFDEAYEGTLGGYALRDRLWFFGAGRKATSPPAGVTNPRFTRRTNLAYSTINDEKRYEGKLTGQITQKHSVVGSYTAIDAKQTGGRFTSAIYDTASLTDRKDPESLFSLNYNGILTQNLLIESLYSKHDYKIGVGGGANTTDLILGTLIRNSADSNSRFNSPTFCGICDTETRNNHSLNLKTNYFLDTKRAGRHTVVGGVEDFSEQRHANNHQSGSDYRVNVSDVVRLGDLNPALTGTAAAVPYVGPTGLLYPRVRNASSTYIRWTEIFTNSNTHNDLKTQSAFINDKWDWSDHWSFNVGLRYDKNNSKDANGNVTSKDSAFSPRLSAIYDVKGDGRHRVSASFNRYVSRIVEGPGTAAESAGSPATIDFFYGGPEINPAGTPQNQLVDQHAALQQMFNWFFANGGTSNLALLRFLKYGVGSAAVPGYSVLFQQQLHSPHVEEVTLGYGAQVGRHAYARLDYVHRDWKDFYGARIDQSTPQATDLLSITHDLNVPFNTNDIKRQYQALQFQSGLNFGRVTGGVNYTYSKLRGNDEGENSLSGTVFQAPLNSYYPEFNGYANRLPIGYLRADQRHRGRVWLGYSQPLGRLGTVTGSILHNIDSGTPYSLVGPIDQTGYTGAPDLGKYVGDQIATDPQGLGGNYYFSARDAFRLPTVQRTDLSLTYSFPISRFELYTKGDVLNVLNRHTLAITALGGPLGTQTTDFATVNTAATSANFLPFNPFTDTPKECPVTATGAECRAMGANFQRIAGLGGPNGKDSYQQPRTFRFYVGMRF
ncbi:MAG: TonB-dependent receptor [Thermoanaerobaculia bacterium]